MTVAITGHLTDGSEITIFNGSDSIFNEMFDVSLDFLKIQKQLVLFAHVYNVPLLQYNLFHKWTCTIKHFLIVKHYNYLMDVILDNVFTHFTLTYDNTVPTDDYLDTKILYADNLNYSVAVPYNKLEDLHNFLNLPSYSFVSSMSLEISKRVNLIRNQFEPIYTIQVDSYKTDHLTIS